MQPEEQSQEPTPTKKPCNTKIPIIVLSVLVVALSGWIIFSKVTADTCEDTSSNQTTQGPEETQPPAPIAIDAELFAADRELVPIELGSRFSFDDAQLTHTINARYPALAVLTRIALFAPITQENSFLTGPELLSLVANESSSMWLVIMPVRSSSAFAYDIEPRVSSLFGVTNPRPILSSSPNVTFSNNFYSIEGSGFGGMFIPTFISNITQNGDNLIVDIHRATPDPSLLVESHYRAMTYEISHHFRFDITLSVRYPIRINSVELVESL